MSVNLADLTVGLKGNNSSFARSMKESAGTAEKAQGRIGRSMAKVKKAVKVAMVGIGVAIGAAAVKGVMDFTKFEGKMNEVFTLMPDITKKAMGDMTGDVKDFAKEFGVLPDKVVPALYQAISAGVPQKNVFKFLEVAQKAAVGGVTELETAVDGISSVVNAYGSDVLSATKASDQMFTAVKLGKTDFNQLSASLFNVIPTAAGIGVEFGNITAALAAMTAQGTPTSVATTQLRQMLVELSKAGSATADTFEDMAGKSFKDFIAEGNNVQDALLLLEEGAIDAGLGVSDMFGSVEAGSAALSLTGKGTEAFTKALEEMETSAGATDKAYKRMEEGMGRSFDKIKAAGAVLLLNFGEFLAPGIAKVADWIVEQMPRIERGLDTVRQWFDDNRPEIEEAIRLLVEALKTIKEHMVPILAKFATFVVRHPKIIAAFGGITLAVWATNRALDTLYAHPIIGWILLFAGATLGAWEAGKKLADLFDVRVAMALSSLINPVASLSVAVANLRKEWGLVVDTVNRAIDAIRLALGMPAIQRTGTRGAQLPDMPATSEARMGQTGHNAPTSTATSGHGAPTSTAKTHAPSRDKGGWVSEGLYRLHNKELVLPPPVSSFFKRVGVPVTASPSQSAMSAGIQSAGSGKTEKSTHYSLTVAPQSSSIDTREVELMFRRMAMLHA